MGLGAMFPDRLKRIWTYRWEVVVDGVAYDVRQVCSWTNNVFIVASEGRELARDVFHTYREDLRLQQITLSTPRGALRFATGARTLVSYGLQVLRGDDVVFQSHDAPFGMHAKLGAFIDTMKTTADNERKISGWSVKPYVLVDFAMVLLLYSAAQLTSLRNVALIGAAAGFAVIMIQWVLGRLGKGHLDLTGGMSALAIPMLLLSAGFAWAFESDFAHQMKPTALGLASALLLVVDAALGGRFLGRAMAGCVQFWVIDKQRVAWLAAAVAAAMALLNAAVVLGLSREAWLVYKYWIQPVLGLTLGLWTLLRARIASPAA